MKVRLDRSRRDCERESEKKKESERRKRKIEKRKKERSREALEQSGVPIRTAKRSVYSRFVRLCPGRREWTSSASKKIVRKKLGDTRRAAADVLLRRPPCPLPFNHPAYPSSSKNIASNTHYNHNTLSCERVNRSWNSCRNTSAPFRNGLDLSS